MLPALKSKLAENLQKLKINIQHLYTNPPKVLPGFQSQNIKKRLIGTRLTGKILNLKSVIKLSTCHATVAIFDSIEILTNYTQLRSILLWNSLTFPPTNLTAKSGSTYYINISITVNIGSIDKICIVKICINGVLHKVICAFIFQPENFSIMI